MACSSEKDETFEANVDVPLLEHSDDSEQANNADQISRISNPEFLEEHQQVSNNNVLFKYYENVEDWQLSFLDNINAGLPSVKIRKKKTSNMKMDQRRTIRQHEKAYCRVSKPPEQPPSLGRRRQMLYRPTNSMLDNVGSFVTSFRRATSRIYRTMQGKERPKRIERIKIRLEDIKDKLTLWANSIREIEGKYGMAIMTYFKFIRWLLFLNIYLSIVMLLFVIIPGSFMLPYRFEQSLSFKNMTDYKTTTMCSRRYQLYIDNFTKKLSVVDKILDFLEGTGWMETKVLFYGAYYNKSTTETVEINQVIEIPKVVTESTTRRPKRDISEVDLSGNVSVPYVLFIPSNKTQQTTNDGSEYKLNYNMGVAYLSAVAVCLIISLVKVVRSSAKNMKATYGREGKAAKYSSRVWAGWDFCICTEKHANSKAASIRTDIVSELQDSQKKRQWNAMTWKHKLEIYSLRVIINVLITLLLGLSLAAIYKVTEIMMQLNSQYHDKLTSLMISYAPYLTITVLNLAVPKVCWRLTVYESYLHETEIKMSITRSILLRLASPMVLLASIYVEILNVDTPPVCGNKRWDDSSSGLTKKIVIKCWENYIGQQLYRLALMDVIVSMFVIFCGNFPRKLIYDRWKKYRIIKFLGQQEFDLPRSVVDLVYSQYLCWLGMFFCPWIPLMTAIKCLILFYLKKLTLMHNCRPEDRPYRTSRSVSLFMSVLLWSYILAVIPLFYVIMSLQPSQSCGPYRLYNDKDATIFNAVKYLVRTWPSGVQSFLAYLFSVGFWSVVIAILIVTCTCIWIIFIGGLKEKQKYLIDEVYWEARDKRYLINLLRGERDEVEDLYQQYKHLRRHDTESKC